MNMKITNEMEDFYHIKYGFSLMTIHYIWDTSANADELNRNFEAAKSLSKLLVEVHQK